MSDWHGWGFSNEKTALHIGKLPNRKQVCLYIIEGSVLEPLAYFRTEESARRALALIEHLLGFGGRE